MATREECENAIKKIREAFYSAICEEWELEQIAVNLDFLSSLINEHFEEKAETNYEHYKDEIIEVSGYCFALVDGKPCQCSGVSCNDCGFSTGHGCGEKIKEWLRKPYEKKTYKLNQFEYDLLQSFLKGHPFRYQFKNINALTGMKEKGYFKGVDEDEMLEDILANCEVMD